MKKEIIIPLAILVLTASALLFMYKAGIIFNNERTPVTKTAPYIVSLASKAGEICAANYYDEVLIHKTQEPNQPAKELTAIVKARCRAVYDLWDIANERMEINEDTLFIDMPPAKLLATTSSPTDIDIITESGEWNFAEEIKNATRDAELTAKLRAIEDHIFTKADRTGRQTISKLFGTMGFLVMYTDSLALQKSIKGTTTVTADSDIVSFVGRTFRENPKTPRQWAAGAYFTFSFTGDYCQIYLTNEYPSEKNNFIEIIVDDLPPMKIRTSGQRNLITIGRPPATTATDIHTTATFADLSPYKHHVTVCRDSETAMGYTQLDSISAPKVDKWSPKCDMKIEFIGNSITCGAESDTTGTPRKDYAWGDWHRAYYSYGAITARNLDAQYSLASVSGIGLIHSCCEMGITMPQVYSKYILRNNEIPYDHKDFEPDIVCCCLGQNDGVQDSAQFCGAYVDFIRQVSKLNPTAKRFVLLSSPMANDELREWMSRMLPTVVARLKAEGMAGVSYYMFPRAWNSGGADHPSVEEQYQIAKELTEYLKTTK